MARDWPLHWAALIGAVAGAAISALAIAGGADMGLQSPVSIVAGGAFWGVAVAWARNRLSRRGRR